jgi:hypothetical protein
VQSLQQLQLWSLQQQQLWSQQQQMQSQKAQQGGLLFNLRLSQNYMHIHLINHMEKMQFNKT